MWIDFDTGEITFLDDAEIVRFGSIQRVDGGYWICNWYIVRRYR